MINYYLENSTDNPKGKKLLYYVNTKHSRFVVDTSKRPPSALCLADALSSSRFRSVIIIDNLEL